MNTNDEIKQEVWDYILDEVHHQKHGRHQLSVRCPFCGDSRTKRSTHMYVKVPFGSEEPMLYHCFLCTSSGIVTPEFLRGLGVTDLHLNGKLIRYNNEMRRTHKALGVSDNTVVATIPVPDQTVPLNHAKKEFLEQRLGRRFTWDELQELRVVFDLGQYLEHNDVERITCKPEKALMLQKDYIGFATTYLEFINFRQVQKNPKGKRYEVYNVYPNLDSTRKMYTIPTNRDLMSMEPLTINVAEGVFDILGVYYHVTKEDRASNMYVATLGSNFTSALKYFIKRGLVGKHININLFSDSDHQPDYYRYLRDMLTPWFGDITLYYNEYDNETDFGVPAHRLSIAPHRIPRR